VRIHTTAKLGNDIGYVVYCDRNTEFFYVNVFIDSVKGGTSDNDSDLNASRLSAHVYYTSAHLNPPTS